MERWNFKMKFSGLTAFVIRPHPLLGARVILMNALNITNQRHRPEFRFDARDVIESPWEIPFPQITKDPAPELPHIWVWHLRFLDLYYLPAPDVTLNQNFELDPATIGYVPNLATISPDANIINSDCLDPKPKTDLVQIRVPLRHGKLSSTKRLVKFKFGPMTTTYNTHTTHEQDCAIEVTLELTVDRGPLTLIGVPFRGGMSSGIAFQPRKDKTEVVIELENRPIEHDKLLRIGTGAEKMDEHAPLYDIDFSLYYNLTQNPPCPEERIVPYYDTYLPIIENCILGRYADDSGA